MRNGEEAQKQVQKHFEKQGYVVLNQNDVGFPDLIEFKNGRISFFVQVKGIQDAHPSPFFHSEGMHKAVLSRELTNKKS